MTDMMTLSSRDRLRLRLRSGVAEATLVRYFTDPLTVREASRRRIEDAAKKEGIILRADAESDSNHSVDKT